MWPFGTWLLFVALIVIPPVVIAEGFDFFFEPPGLYYKLRSPPTVIPTVDEFIILMPCPLPIIP